MTQPLDGQTEALVRAAVAIARGDADRLRERLRGALAAGVPPAWIEELLLQSLLNVGYPLALAAWEVWREVGGPYRPGEGEEALAHTDWEQWARRGADTCAQVYGRSYTRLLLNLRALHPALEALVVVDAYGKLLGRPALDLARRELCTLAAVAALDKRGARNAERGAKGATSPAPRQLRAHQVGALNVGWSKEQVEAVMRMVEED